MRAVMFLAAAAFLVVSTSTVEAASTPIGQYWVHDRLPFSRRAEVDLPRGTNDSLLFSRAGVSLPGYCPATSYKLSAEKKKGTRLTATWQNCPAYAKKIDFDGVFDSTNGTLIGSIKLHQPAIPILDVKTPVIASTVTGESVRIGTYNVQFLPSTLFTKDEEDATKMAARIVATGYDFIALNEVFDEDAREKFIDGLTATYPHYVEFLDADAPAVPPPPHPDFFHEDSGLMLFSRFPFEALPNNFFLVESDNCEGSDCGKVAFLQYLFTAGDDGYSDKGIGFVRLRNPQTNHIYNVGFSHTNASYPPPNYPTEKESEFDALMDFEARRLQLEDIALLLAFTLSPAQLNTEDVFILGDLNVDGDLADPDLGPLKLNLQNLYEWQLRFGTPGAFFHDLLEDAWAFDTSPDDRGLSNLKAWGAAIEDAGGRLDYILKSKNRRLCAQHMTLAHNLRWSPAGGTFTESGMGMAGVDELSDHIGVNADLNLQADYCSAAEPRPALALPGIPLTLAGQITFPGSMQWVRFDQAGTYSFAIAGSSGADFRVYVSTDLSTPIPQYHGETTEIGGTLGPPVTGKKFHIPEAPFYIRVFNPDRSKSGAYSLITLRHNCTSKNEACILGPAELWTQALKDSPVNADDTSWFELHTDAPDSGQPQLQRLVVSPIPQIAADVWSMELREQDGVTVIASDDVPEPGANNTVTLQIERGESQERKMYLLVKRDFPDSPPYPAYVNVIKLSWTTNLTILFGNSEGVGGAESLNIHCFEQTDDTGDDDIYLTVWVDGTKIVDDVYLGEYDEGNGKSVESKIPTIRFLNEVKVQMREDDGGLTLGDDFLIRFIEVLPRSEENLVKTNRTFKDQENDGLYRFYFTLAHALDK